jgi:hypothetical protein
MPTQSVTELADRRQSRSAVIVTLGLALRLLPRYSYYVNGWYLSSWSLQAEVVAQRHLDRGLLRARNFATSWQRFVQAQSAAQNSGIRCWPKRRRLLTIQPTLRAASRPKFCARPSSLIAQHQPMQWPPRDRLSWVRILRVCRHWRMVALDASVLWTTLQFGTPASTEAMLEYSRSALHKRSHPISFNTGRRCSKGSSCFSVASVGEVCS